MENQIPLKSDVENLKAHCGGCHKEVIAFERRSDVTCLSGDQRKCTHECSECGYKGTLNRIAGNIMLVDPAAIFF